MSWIAGVFSKDAKETQDRIARKEGFDPGMVKEIGYSNDKITTGKLGSSERYGYRHAGEKLWQVPQHVQLFSHTLAY